MAIKPQNRKPVRSLLTMLVIVVGLIGFLASTKVWSDGAFTPKLGLDLEGGQQVILKPVVRDGEGVNASELSQAVDIMRNRVDGQGVSEAEVATLGDQITVTVPGRMTAAQQESLKRSSQMRFRPVLYVASTEPEPTATGTATAGASSTATAKATATGTAKATAKATATAKASSTRNAVVPRALTEAGTGRLSQPLPKATATPTAVEGVLPATATATKSAAATTKPATATGTATAAATATTAPGAEPTISAADKTDFAKLAAYASNEAWLEVAKYQTAFVAFDCANQGKYDPTTENLDKPTVACSDDRTAKYLLGPSVLVGSEIADATSAAATNQQGQPTGGYEVRLKISGDATKKYYEISKYMVPLTTPRNQLAVVLDNQIVSAPYFSSAIPDGTAQITGNFSQETAKLLADQLKFGALPMSFEFSSSVDISPTLGGDSLAKGLIAGLIGLLLVILYSLAQYRALGFVTIASLLLVSGLTYGMLTLFGWSHNLRLTMAGITGAIVAIGTTADSFIVYFERVRDEVREGRALRAAVETGWARAKRTILISDAVNFLAAAVLYILASSNVRGFAFMLMLTTILDVIVVFLFTHPLLTVLASSKFFGGGHKWSGFDPEHLGAQKMRYAGRGRIVTGASGAAGTAGTTTGTAGSGRTIADRKRANPAAGGHPGTATSTEGGPA